MLKIIVTAAVVVLITSSSAIGGIVLTHAAIARTSTFTAGISANDLQSFPRRRQGAADLRLVGRP